MYTFVWPTPDPGQGRYWPQGAGGRSDAPGSAWAMNGKALTTRALPYLRSPHHLGQSPSGAVEKAVEIVEHMFYNGHSSRPGKEGKAGSP